jgi:hypothetical protein
MIRRIGIPLGQISLLRNGHGLSKAWGRSLLNSNENAFTDEKVGSARGSFSDWQSSHRVYLPVRH